MKKTLLLATAFMAALVAAPYTTESEMINAEAQYALELSIDTMEIPKNWMSLTSNYRVELPVRVSNNPGITSLSFIAKSDKSGLLVAKHAPNTPFKGVGCSFYANNVPIVKLNEQNEDDIYYDLNGIICYMYVTIPENADYGDFIEVDFAPEYTTAGQLSEVFYTKTCTIFFKIKINVLLDIFRSKIHFNKVSIICIFRYCNIHITNYTI